MWDQAEQGLKSGWCFSDGICRWDQKYLQSDIMGTRFRRVTFQLAEAHMTSWQRIGCLVSGLLESLCGSHDGLGGDRRGHAPQGQISCATQEVTQEMLLHISGPSYQVEMPPHGNMTCVHKYGLFASAWAQQQVFRAENATPLTSFLLIGCFPSRGLPTHSRSLVC